MSVMPDWWIRQMGLAGMITPFEPRLISNLNQKTGAFDAQGSRVISFGVASAAYDVCLGCEFAYYREDIAEPLDPLNVTEHDVVRIVTDEYIIPPNGVVLGTTIETFDIPRGVVANMAEKSTYKRPFVSVGNTRMEPEWRGQITLEIKNDNPVRSIVLRAGQGIAAVEFHLVEADGRGCEISYADRKGKYMDQMGVTLPT